jgi:uncharacterized protein (TIGR02145 family)
VNDGLYGKLYNHYAVTDSRGLCPTGWHIPSDGEWTTLENHLGGSGVAGGALKSTAMQPTPGGWNSPNSGATNSSGFSALPGGIRYDGAGGFDGVEGHGRWWSFSAGLLGSDVFYRGLYSSVEGVERDNFHHRRSFGMSVRCLKNTLPQVNTTSVTNVTPSSAFVTGEVISEGGDQNIVRRPKHNKRFLLFHHIQSNHFKQHNHEWNGYWCLLGYLAELDPFDYLLCQSLCHK